MANVTAAMVKELREKTGAGMMDCKKALNETGGDLQQAMDWLRKKGLSIAAKKSSRAATEGLVALVTEGNCGVIIEINTETDFVARNKDFQSFVEMVAKVALSVGDNLDNIMSATLPTNRTVADEILFLIATIGENISLRRARYLRVEEGIVGSYIHNALRPGIGKIGVLIALKSSSKTDLVHNIGRQLGMHIAASKPTAITVEGVPSEVVEYERAILLDQVKDSGRPDDVKKKIVEGRLRKFYEEVVLLEQPWVHDGVTKVKDVLKQANVELKDFVRFQLGEGIEKK